MKKIIVCVALLFITLSSFSQYSNPGQTLTREDYLKKSKNQKTTALVFLGGGAVLIGAGIITGSREEVSFNAAATAVVVAGIGVLSVVGSIILFNASSRNHRKAMNATAYFDMRQYPFARQAGLTFRSFPALSVKIHF
jgi:hypothetical protein